MSNSAEAQSSENKGSSRKARVLSARLRAAQAVYQFLLNGGSLRDIAAEYLSVRLDMEIEGEPLVTPDKDLLKVILLGVGETFADLEVIVDLQLNPAADVVLPKDSDVSDESDILAKPPKKRTVEPLLKAILLCAAYEIAVKQDVDAPILINDYLNVTHAFYEQGESSLVNGILDKIAKASR